MGAKEDPKGVDDKTWAGEVAGGKHGGRGAQEACVQRQLKMVFGDN
jgi:hypothetical protein